jgi:hypothetical protein
MPRPFISKRDKHAGQPQQQHKHSDGPEPSVDLLKICPDQRPQLKERLACHGRSSKSLDHASENQAGQYRPANRQHRPVLWQHQAEHADASQGPGDVLGEPTLSIHLGQLISHLIDAFDRAFANSHEDRPAKGTWANVFSLLLSS